MAIMLATYNITGEWFLNLEELVEHIEELGYEVLEANREYVVIYNAEREEEYIAYLGGTERTIYINKFKVA